MERAPRIDRRTALALAGLWAVATALGVTKPFHVDDAYYVAQAEWIAEHPTRPTSGEIFWDTDQPAPFHATGNSPVLVPFLLAAVIRAVGPSEVALHLVIAMFSGLAIVLFHELARRLAAPHALTLTALLVLSPAFVAEQNVMLDIPLLASWLAFFVAFGDGASSTRWWRAAAIAAVALLIKLTSVALVLFLVAEAVRTRRWARLSTLALPVGALVAWSTWNVLEHGSAQVLARPLAHGALEVATGRLGVGALAGLGVLAGRAALWVVVLGGVLTGPLLLLPRLGAPALGRRALVGGAALALLFPAGRWLVAESSALGAPQLAGEPWPHTLLRGVFFVGAALLLLACAERLREGGDEDARLGLWLAAGSLVVVVVAPFVAARHALLVVPPVLLLVGRAAPATLGGHGRAAVALAALVGLGAAVADHRIATVYRDAPARLLAGSGPHQRAYFVGHWGWQRYATAAGLIPYVPGRTRLAEGDILVVPRGVHAQPILPEDRALLEPLREDVVPAGPLDLFRTLVDGEGLYCSWVGLPWSLRTDEVARFTVLGHRVRSALPGREPDSHPADSSQGRSDGSGRFGESR
jgi:hypothetical protein